MATTLRPSVPAAEEIIGGYFPVLDHGFVALVDYMGGDRAIERAARQSYGSGTRATTSTRGLLRYLRRHAHTSPTEMTELVFHISMPIFVARQWIRHRTASLNELSGRYSVMPMLFYTPAQEHLCVQAKNNKQGRAEPVCPETHADMVGEWNRVRRQNAYLYEDLLADGVARELARIDLPLSTYTQMTWKIDLHNLLHFLRLRCDGHAQYEIRAFANVIAGIVKRLAPITFEAWIDYDFGGERFSRAEMDIIRSLVRTLHHPPDDSHSVFCKALGIVAPADLEMLLGSKREVQEFVTKLNGKKIPDFELDLSTMKTADHFHDQMATELPQGAA
jgi:thymidylate synthase (FAD)